jgi:hypothetical protein
MTALAFMIPAGRKPVGFLHLKIFENQLLPLGGKRSGREDQQGNQSRGCHHIAASAHVVDNPF